MKNLVFIVFVAGALLISSCSSNKDEKGKNLNGIHKVEVQEVLQAKSYTYLNVTESGKEFWLAVLKTEAEVGDVFYFKDFMEMKNFKSKDLERVFETVYFVEKLSVNPEAFNPVGHMNIAEHQGKPSTEQEKIKVQEVEGAITIAELFKNREQYDGQKVVIRGKVVKANFGIMDRNWFHIQDGTEHEGNFDLTITSNENEVKEGNAITFEGIVSLNKDFGHGYKYDIILEKAVKK